MRKKIFSGLMATALTVTMLGGTVLANGATTPQQVTDVEVEGQVVSIDNIYDVILPTTVKYAIDAEDIFGEGQVISGEYGVINHGTTPIKLDVNAYATVTGSAVALGTYESVSNTAVSVTKPAMYLALAATSAKPADFAITSDGIVTFAAVTFGAATVNTLTPAAVITTSSATTVSFALDKAPYTIVTSGSLEGMDMAAEYVAPASEVTDDAIGFTLTGKVNKTKEWKNIVDERDIKINLKFSFTELSDEDYADVEYVDGSYGLVGGSTGGSATAYSEWGNSINGYYVGIDADTAFSTTPTSIKANGVALSSSDYSVDGDGWLVITWKDAWTTDVTLTCVVGNTTYTVVLEA